MICDRISLKVICVKNRSELREIIMKVLYQSYIYDASKTKYDIFDLIKENLEVENSFVNTIILGIRENEEDILTLANKYLEGWDINRLSKVDKAIFCIGIYELKYTDTPSVVCINEAIELSKKYSDEKVVKMLNATLDKIYHKEVLHES